MNRHKKDESHARQDQAKFKKTDAEVRKQLSEEKPERPHRRNEELFECAAFLFANDGERGQEGSDVQQHDGGEPGKEEIRRARIRVEKQLRPHVDSELRTIFEDSPKRF